MMKLCKIVEKQKQKVIASNVQMARTFFERLKGLMFKEFMAESEGMIITPCNSIHTFFMNFPIDVVFLDKEYRVVKVYRSLKPWRVTPMFFSAKHVLELPGGSLPEEIKEKDQLEVVCLS